MEEKITIPFNDVFFYGLSLRSRDVSDVRGDIFSNIFMKYLRSLKPVSNRLYRSTDNAKYEYSYVFVPSKPLSWRVIKNRRVIEDIEYLSDGKYCLNYYDDNGNDSKRIIYNNNHRWLKTNYYNNVYGSTLLCTLVPKEQNGQTVILQYITGEAYPITLFCCPLPSCNEVLNKILERVPEPEVMALTNYGILYFACEETYNIYNQVLDEEEEKFIQAHKPEVFNTPEDVENGFCFDVDNFDTTKNISSSFDLNSADELTEEYFAEIVPADSVDSDPPAEVVVSVETDREYSIEKEIAEVIKVISEETNIDIDKDLVLNNSNFSESEKDAVSDLSTIPDTSDSDDKLTIVDLEDNNIDIFPSVDDTSEVNKTDVDSYEEPLIVDESVIHVTDIEENIIFEDNDVEPIEIQSAVTDDSVNLLTMDDNDIDDYVSSLIDSILLDAHNTASEFMINKEDVFTQAENEASTVSIDMTVKNSSLFIDENPADSIIESNGAKYYYYGNLDEDNNRSGRGKTLMDDGKTAYDGFYLNDMRHGVGSFYYKDGNLCYWGEWKENLRNGFGVGVSSETGITHIGTWMQNKPEGIGVRFDKDGNFMYLDSACHHVNGGIRVTGFTDNSVLIEFWDEKSLKIVKKELFIDDLLK